QVDRETRKRRGQCIDKHERRRQDAELKIGKLKLGLDSWEHRAERHAVRIVEKTTEPEQAHHQPRVGRMRAEAVTFKRAGHVGFSILKNRSRRSLRKPARWPRRSRQSGPPDLSHASFNRACRIVLPSPRSR